MATFNASLIEELAAIAPGMPPTASLCLFNDDHTNYWAQINNASLSVNRAIRKGTREEIERFLNR